MENTDAIQKNQTGYSRQSHRIVRIETVLNLIEPVPCLALTTGQLVCRAIFYQGTIIQLCFTPASFSPGTKY